MGTIGLGSKLLIHKKSGFTLIEVLISLSIFAALLSTLLLGFRQGLLNWEKSVKQKHYTHQLLSRHNWLEKMINEAIIEDYSKHNSVSVPYFKGTAQQVSWMTNSPLLDAPGHIRPVSLKWKKTAEGYSLYYREADLHSDPKRTINWSQPWVELIQSVEQGQFSYEAPAFPLLDDVAEQQGLSEIEKKRYRDEPEWLVDFNSYDLWRTPLRVKISFVDTKKLPHQWTFSLPNRMNAWHSYFYE